MEEQCPFVLVMVYTVYAIALDFMENSLQDASFLKSLFLLLEMQSEEITWVAQRGDALRCFCQYSISEKLETIWLFINWK